MKKPPDNVELALVELQELEDVTITAATTGRMMVGARRVREEATRREVVLASKLGNHVMTMHIGGRVHVMSADLSFHPIYGGRSGTVPSAEHPDFHAFQF